MLSQSLRDLLIHGIKPLLGLSLSFSTPLGEALVSHAPLRGGASCIASETIRR